MSRPSEAIRRFISCRTPGALRRLRDAGDEGFTLIELVIALVILPLIIGAVAFALITTLMDQAQTGTRLSDSVDSQVTSTYYNRDVQSAQYVTTTATPGSPPWASPPVCGSGASYILGLAWADGSSTGETVVSYWRTEFATGTGTVAGNVVTASSPIFKAYEQGDAIVQTGGTAIPLGTRIVAVSSSGTSVTLSRTTPARGTAVHFLIAPSLVRDYCKGTSAPSVVTTSQDFFAPFLHAVVSCVGVSSTCVRAASQWVSTVGVSTVDLSVVEPSGHYDYNVSAVPRASNGATSVAGVPPKTTHLGPRTFPTLLLIGGTEVVQEQSTSNVTVVGTAAINNGYFKQQNKAAFYATTTSKNPPKQSVKNIWTTRTPVSGICTTQGAQCNGKPPSPATQATHTTYITDPLTDLPEPPAAKIEPCPVTQGGVVDVPPGQYTCLVQASGTGHKVVLTHSGLYEFDDGITVNGGASLTAQAGVFIYLPCNTIDHWDPLTTCSETFAVKNSGLRVNPIPEGPYEGLWLWENKGDSSPVTIAGPATYAVTGKGILYAPSATVKLRGGSVTNTVGQIDAARLYVSNGTFVITGRT